MAKKRESRDQKRRRKKNKRSRDKKFEAASRAVFAEGWAHLLSDKDVTIQSMGWTPNSGRPCPGKKAAHRYVMNVVTVMGHLGQTLSKTEGVPIIYCNIDDKKDEMGVNVYLRADHPIAAALRQYGWRGVRVNVIIDPTAKTPESRRASRTPRVAAPMRRQEVGKNGGSDGTRTRGVQRHGSDRKTNDMPRLPRPRS